MTVELSDSVAIILVTYVVFSLFTLFVFIFDWNKDRIKEQEKELKSKIMHEIFENNIITSGRFEGIESRIKKLEDDKK